MNQDLEKQYKDQQQALKAYATHQSEKLNEKKEADIKWLEEEYKAKMVEFKNAMEDIICYINK